MPRDAAAQVIIDEPLERGGTNQGFTPTETLMASLIGEGCNILQAGNGYELL